MRRFGKYEADDNPTLGLVRLYEPNLVVSDAADRASSGEIGQLDLVAITLHACVYTTEGAPYFSGPDEAKQLPQEEAIRLFRRVEDLVGEPSEKKDQVTANGSSAS